MKLVPIVVLVTEQTLTALDEYAAFNALEGKS